MRYHSKMKPLGATAAFPEFTGERIYMQPFLKREGLPADLARWQPLVDSMIATVEVDGPLFLMVDQAELEAGQYHRRPGLHVDGYWNGSSWGTQPPEWQPVPGRTFAGGGDSHRPIVREGGQRQPGHMGDRVTWAESPFTDPEAIILASDVRACLAILGEFEGPIGEGGDCSAVTFTDPSAVMLEAGYAYAGNVTLVHETLRVPVPGRRTVVRINTPGWHPVF